MKGANRNLDVFSFGSDYPTDSEMAAMMVSLPVAIARAQAGDKEVWRVSPVLRDVYDGRKTRLGGQKGGLKKADDRPWSYACIRDEVSRRRQRGRYGSIDPTRMIVAVAKEIADSQRIGLDAAEKRVRRAVQPMVQSQRSGNRSRLTWKGQ